MESVHHMKQGNSNDMKLMLLRLNFFPLLFQDNIMSSLIFMMNAVVVAIIIVVIRIYATIQCIPIMAFPIYCLLDTIVYDICIRVVQMINFVVMPVMAKNSL